MGFPQGDHDIIGMGGQYPLPEDLVAAHLVVETGPRRLPNGQLGFFSGIPQTEADAPPVPGGFPGLEVHRHLPGLIFHIVEAKIGGGVIELG